MRKLLALLTIFASPALAQQPNGTINSPIYATGYISQVGGANVTTKIPPQPNHPTNLNIYTVGAISGTWTIQLPNPAFEGQILSFSCGGSAAAISITSSDGSTVDSNLPTACVGASTFAAQFDQRNNIWRYIGYGNTAGIVPSQLPAFTGGDCTTSAGSVALSCTKTNGVAFAASATTDTTNASNISSGTLAFERLPYVVPAGSTQSQINTALNAGLPVILKQGVTYTITAPIVLKNGSYIYAQGATIAASVGYSSNYMVAGASNAVVMYGTFDGSNLPSPSGAWLGVGVPVGSIVSGDGTTTACDNMIFSDVTFKNSPSGPVFLRQCSNALFDRPVAINTQTYTSNITNAVFEVYGYTLVANTAGGNYNVFRDAVINGYNWKAINIGNSIGSQVVRPHAYGGTQNVGYAAFYEEGAIDTNWDSPRHDGTGFGFKTYNFLRTTLRNPTFNGSASAVYAQRGTDFKLIGGTYTAPNSSNIGIQIEANTGPIAGVLVNGFTARRTVAGSTTNHVGFRVLTDGVNAASDVTLVNSTFDAFYEGVGIDNVANAAVSDVRIIGNRFTNIVAYGVLALLHSGEITGNTITTTTAGSPAIVASMVGGAGAGGNVKISNNTTSGPTAIAHIQIGTGYGGGATQWPNLTVSDNVGSGGGDFIDMNWSVNATDYIKVLEFSRNKHINAAIGSNAFNLTLNATTTSVLHVHENSAIATNGTQNAFQYVSNYANIVVGSTMDGNTVSPIYNRPCLMRPMGVCTVATLPSSGTIVGERAFVSDSSVTTFNSAVAGGGANYVPVFRDNGATWRVGG